MKILAYAILVNFLLAVIVGCILTLAGLKMGAAFTCGFATFSGLGAIYSALAKEFRSRQPEPIALDQYF